MDPQRSLGLCDALKLTLDRIKPLEMIRVDILDGLNHALAEDIFAEVDSPSIDASMKDGYAVLSGDIQSASSTHTVRLQLVGSIAAGESSDCRLQPGCAVKVLTGARLPSGANAVIAEEFTNRENDTITICNNAEPGRNILTKGSDVTAGQLVAAKGTLITPGMAGMLAAAGLHRIPVVRRPSISIVATGDELVAPGKPLPKGKLYASNMTTLSGWCRKYTMQCNLDIVGDDRDEISATLNKRAESADAIITSGGAWTSDRDLIAGVLARLGWEQVFHRIRIGPGKATGFGFLGGKPVFILPGGPPSNLTGFLQIALPGLLKLAGHRHTGLPTTLVQLAAELKNSHADWTQCIYGTLEKESHVPLFHPLQTSSRLHSMAQAKAITAIPEGKTILPAGSIVMAQLLE